MDCISLLVLHPGAVPVSTGKVALSGAGVWEGRQGGGISWQGRAEQGGLSPGRKLDR